MIKKIKSALFAVFKGAYNVLKRTPLRKIPGMLALSNLFFRMFWPNENIINIQGFKMYINVNEPNRALRETFQGYGMDLIHEEATTKLFKDLVNPGDVIIDLGANIGYFTLLAAKLVGPRGKIFAFEPEPLNFRYLVKNIKINKLGNVSAFQKAVSNKEGYTDLFVCGYDSGHHTINQESGIEAYRRSRSGETRKIKIETVTLDNFLREKTTAVNVMKVDIEGAENLALEGARRILEQNRSIKIFLEFFPLLIKKMGSSPENLIDTMLHEYQFNVFIIGQDYDMKDSDSPLTAIKDYKDLAAFIRNNADHVNLYLSREPKMG